MTEMADEVLIDRMEGMIFKLEEALDCIRAELTQWLVEVKQQLSKFPLDGVHGYSVHKELMPVKKRLEEMIKIVDGAYR